MTMKDVKGIIFDVDGTLAGSVEFFYEIALEVLKLAKVPPVSREKVYAMMRVGDESPLRKLFPTDHPDPEGTVQRITESRMDGWLKRYHEDTKAIPGTLEVLNMLHRKGFVLGIATSSGRALPFLDSWGVRHLFGTIIGREDVENRKPHPEPVFKCLDGLGIEPTYAVYIGDSPIDIQAGKAAGVRTIGVLTGTSDNAVMIQERPDHILPSVSDLPTLLHL